MSVVCCRSAPSSPTHHPLLSSDITLRDVEAKFALPHTPPSQFSLPPTLFPSSSLHSSASLPASPSRPHPTFPGPFKFFAPIGVRSTSIEALAPEIARKRDLLDDDGTPHAKRIRGGKEEGEETRIDQAPAIMKQIHPITLPSLPGAVGSFTQPRPPPSVQFFPIPMVNQPSLPTFLPAQSFAVPTQQSPADLNDHSPSSNEEG